MKNDVFTKAVEAVEAFQKDYQERLAAAEKQLAQLEEKRTRAEDRAEAAVAADDQTAWRKADKDRTDAAAGIKFTQERLAMIRSGAAYPLPEYDALLDQIDAELAKATLEFIEEMQAAYMRTLEVLEKLQVVLDDGREALEVIYSSGGGEAEGYRTLENYQANWGYLLRNGEAFKGICDFDIKTGRGLSGSDPIQRAVLRAKAAIRREEGKE